MLDTTAPAVSVKPESVSSNGRYRVVSFKLEDAAAGQIDKVLINGVVKDLTNNKWSDVNDVAPGVFGAREGDNTIVVFDTAGNTASMSFVLDTKGPDVTVKPESQGAAGAYRTVSFKLHDEAFVDKVMINGVLKDLSNNAWSDVNGVTPGQNGAVEGANTLVAYDALGNTTTTTFMLDTTAPAVSASEAAPAVETPESAPVSDTAPATPSAAEPTAAAQPEIVPTTPAEPVAADQGEVVATSPAEPHQPEVAATTPAGRDNTDSSGITVAQDAKTDAALVADVIVTEDA